VRIIRYAVRFSVLLNYFGQLCVVMACLTVVPLAVSLVFGDFQVSWRYAVLVVAIVSLGMLLTRLKAPQGIQTNEAMAVTAGIFLFAPMVLAWPVTAVGIPVGDALFETISGVTTTGLSTIETLDGKPDTFLFSRAWMQWVGGLGITVLTVAVMIQPGLAAKRLDFDEDYDDDLIGSTRTHARRTLVVYTLLTVAGTIGLMLSGTDWFESMLYTFAAVSTGGFAPHDGSLRGLTEVYPQVLVTGISMAGGVSLLLYWRLYKNGWRALVSDRQLPAFLAVGLAATLLTAFFLWIQDGHSWVTAITQGALNALSAQSTAGFASMDMATIGDGAKLSLILTMAIGGSMGSTAGGLKIIRLLVVIRLLSTIVKQAGSPPNAVSEAALGGRRIERREIEGVLCVVGAFIGLITLSWFPFVAMGHAPLDALFEVVSAVATAGLSTGITDAQLHPFLKGVLCVDMLLGRLEILAWLVVFYPGTWLGLRKEQ
jgi:trk system potassium uptake protein TrkH